MLQFKIHIARILCFASMILLGTNIAFSSIELVDDKYATNDAWSDDVASEHFNIEKEELSLLNLIKDPTECDDYEYIPSDQVRFFFTTFSFHEQIQLNLSNYSPFIIELPLWIKHRQIRI